MCEAGRAERYFYPRPPRGGRRMWSQISFHSMEISIHALREEGDQHARRQRRTAYISIHALREEGDWACGTRATTPRYFYPRPPRGGRLRASYSPPGPPRISIHALREEGDGVPEAIVLHVRVISIHALREEGDSLSRASRRRFPISIHALREEGDALSVAASGGASSFLSTPSARRATWIWARPRARPRDFYPRPPRGGRPAAA